MPYLDYFFTGCILIGFAAFIALCTRKQNELHKQFKGEYTLQLEKLTHYSNATESLTERISKMEQAASTTNQQPLADALQVKQQGAMLAHIEQRILALELLTARASAVAQLGERITQLEALVPPMRILNLEARVAVLEHETHQIDEPVVYSEVLSLVQSLMTRIKIIEKNARC